MTGSFSTSAAMFITSLQADLARGPVTEKGRQSLQSMPQQLGGRARIRGDPHRAADDGIGPKVRA